MAIFGDRRQRRTGKSKAKRPASKDEARPSGSGTVDRPSDVLLKRPASSGTHRSALADAILSPPSTEPPPKNASDPLDLLGSTPPSPTHEAPGRDASYRRARKEESTVATIGKSTNVKGDIHGAEDLWVDGTVEGSIRLPDHSLTVGAEGTVTANVEAKSIHVIGRVSGNVVATDIVEVQSDGAIGGDIQSPRLTIEDGAIVNGSLVMSKTASKTQPARTEMKKVAPTGETKGSAESA